MARARGVKANDDVGAGSRQDSRTIVSAIDVELARRKTPPSAESVVHSDPLRLHPIELAGPG